MTKTLRLIMLLAAGVLTASCGGGEEPIAVSFTGLDGVYDQVWPVRTYVIQDEQAWQTAWDEHLAQGDSGAEKPSVDFGQFALLGVSMGWGGCETLVIDRVTRYGSDLKVEYRVVQPPANAGCAAVLVAKVRFVLLPGRVQGRVEFVQAI